jgi:putative tricarboxylic transport membrane protein
MALDRWIALAFIALCCVYGYAAFFTMDDSLPPILRRNPMWPSTFPKMLAVAGIVVGMIVLFSKKPQAKEGAAKPDGAIDLTRLGDYHIGQALGLIGLMLAYAFALRPLGFLSATVLFLVLGATILGERKFHILVPVAALAAGSIWYLVQEVLGIFLRPWPSFWF